MSTSFRKVRYGFAVCSPEAKRYFPIRALNISNFGYPNVYTFRFGAPGFIHSMRASYESHFGLSVIVYPV